MIDHVQDPPASGPTLADGVGNPVGPESARYRYRRQIGVPGVPGILRHDAALFACFVGRRVRSVEWLLLENSSHRRLPDVNTRSCQNIGDLHLAKRWAEQLDLLDGIPNKVGKSIHRCLRLDE